MKILCTTALLYFELVPPFQRSLKAAMTPLASDACNSLFVLLMTFLTSSPIGIPKSMAVFKVAMVRFMYPLVPKNQNILSSLGVLFETDNDNIK